MSEVQSIVVLDGCAVSQEAVNIISVVVAGVSTVVFPFSQAIARRRRAVAPNKSLVLIGLLHPTSGVYFFYNWFVGAVLLRSNQAQSGVGFYQHNIRFRGNVLLCHI